MNNDSGEDEEETEEDTGKGKEGGGKGEEGEGKELKRKKRKSKLRENYLGGTSRKMGFDNENGEGEEFHIPKDKVFDLLMVASYLDV